MTQLVQLTEAAPEEAIRWFRETDATEITTAIHDTDDAALSALLASDSFRQAGIEAILARFPEFADGERLAAIDGTACFDLAERGGVHERYVLRFHRGAVTVLEGDAAQEADVTIRAAIVPFVRLVTGQENAALLYLSDRLGIEGDAMLALAVGTVFRVPGTDQAVVEPTTLDPVEVSRAISDVSTRHLAEVMSGGFREIVVSEVFRRIPDFVDARKAAKADLAIGFRVGDRADGGADRFLVHVRGGDCAVTREPAADARRDATLVLDGPTFLRLVLGHVNPVRALLGGKLGLKGDRAKALAFHALMNIPGS